MGGGDESAATAQDHLVARDSRRSFKAIQGWFDDHVVGCKLVYIGQKRCQWVRARLRRQVHPTYHRMQHRLRDQCPKRLFEREREPTCTRDAAEGCFLEQGWWYCR